MKNSTNKFSKSFILICASILINSLAQAQSSNYFAGSGTGAGNTGSFNTVAGFNAFQNFNSGDNNVGLGLNALYTNTSGNYNTAIGSLALYHNTTGFNNVANGEYSLYSNDSGDDNTAIGAASLYGNTKGFSNTAVGVSSLGNTVGYGNCAFGNNASASGDSGSYNNAFGYDALYFSKGKFNCAFGTFALFANTTGNENSVFGNEALYYNTTGYNNTSMGDSSLLRNTTGYSNTAIGKNAGVLQAVYNKCTLVGTSADVSASGKTNATAIGYGAKVNASNKVQVGNTAVTSIGGQVGWTTFSDVRLKTNINNSKLGLDFILHLRPVTYNYKDAAQKDILYTGLIAQEVDAAAKKEGVEFSGVDKNGEYWGIRYGDLTVPLVKGMQEQQSVIESQQNEIKELRNEITLMKSALSSNQLQKGASAIAGENKLEQNTPNPFTEKTIIKFYIPQNAVNGVIKIYSLDGSELTSIVISTKGFGQIEISGKTLSAGTYTYMLLVDGKVVDTKQMVLTK